MSKKKIIVIISILAVVLLSASVASYSIANLGNGTQTNDSNNISTEMTKRGAAGGDFTSTIDIIIENSNKDPGENYNVVEIIPPSASPSDLEAYISSELFKKCVFDANSQKDPKGVMASGRIKLDTIKVSGSTTLDEKMASNITGEISTLRDILDNADLIYMSSPTYKAYDGNMSEDIYNKLHTYAMGQNKPVIIDYVNKNDTSVVVTNKKYSDLVSRVLSQNGIRFMSWKWDTRKSNADGTTGVSAVNFFNGSQSLFYKYRTDQKAATGKVLVITENASQAGTMYDRMKNANENEIINLAYFGNAKPKKFTYTTMAPSAVTAANIEGYDFILLENNIMNSNIPDDVYAALKSMSESGKYIFYDYDVPQESSGGSAVNNNYLKLMNLLVTSNGTSKYSNVLAIKYGYFTSLNNAGEDGLAGAKAIADIINTAEYRDSATTGEAGKKYKVLEIQPCYPIDEEIAQSNETTTTKYTQPGAKGGYYTIPDQVLYGVTKDEIEEGMEYYAFEMSKAKISHATGIPYNQIQIDQMSVNQLISTKDVVLENYDLVYIGGDTSALVTHEYVNFSGTSGWVWGGDQNTALKNLTCFDMYTHTGSLVDYAFSYGSVAGGTNSVEFSGHDLTTIKRDELIDYVDSGLPIIIDKEVTDAFSASYKFDPNNKNAEEKNRLKQLALMDIDPDCNMYQFLTYAYEQRNNVNGNVCWGKIDVTSSGATVKTENPTLEWGNTGNVTVYKSEYENILNSLIKNAVTRPALKITSKPKEYVEGNVSTYNTDPAAKFAVTVTGTGNYKVELYIDSNGDAIYSETELEDSVSCSGGGNVNLTYALEPDFFGLVNWKIKVTEQGGVLCDTRMGSAIFKLDSELKKKVKVLQIMPVERGQQGVGTGFSLYFCTECQQAMQLLKNNVVVSGKNFAGANGSTKLNPGLNSATDYDTVCEDVKVGTHEHKFGIVKYDTVALVDDWEDNFADELTIGEDGTLETGDFEFDLDIVTPAEFDEMCAAAAGRSEDIAEANAINAENAYSDYESALESANLASARTTLESELYSAADKVRANVSNGERDYNNAIIKGIGTATEPGLWMINQDYYKFWEYCNDKISGSIYGSLGDLSSLKTAYNNYITLYDEVLEKKELYKKYSREAGLRDTWLEQNYSIIVLGMADNFNNKDLAVESCNQLKTYVEAGGSLLNTHDTMAKRNNTGAVNLTNTLRATFGMDRFHVTDYSSSKSVNLSLKIPKPSTKNLIIGQGINEWYLGPCPDIQVDNRDITIKIHQEWGNVDFGHPTVEYGTEHTSATEKIKVTVIITGMPGQTFKYYDRSLPLTASNIKEFKLNGNAVGTFEIDQAVDYDVYSKALTIGKNNITATYDIGTGEFTAAANDTAVSADGKLKVEVTVKNNGSNVADGTAITAEFRGVTQTGTVTNGVVSFMIDPKQDAATSIYDQPSGIKYRHYPTEDASKYFWTQRLQAETEAQEKEKANNVSNWLKYNAPVGVTDLFAANDSSSNPVSNYLYVQMSSEGFDHVSNVDGVNFEAKYGTRKAAKVNQGGVTTYPFAISDELLISPTHAQIFTLDLEDPNVAVWYTLGANFVSTTPSVSAEFARYDSGIFTASPKDGMNSYFLYSKNNVFYCGAGHQIVTGILKDNNDERRLFINVIVNSVSKGVANPKLKLYNKCDEAGNKHTNCDDNFVDPKEGVDDADAMETKKKQKEMNVLFYNKGIGMYQYNIDESQTEITPEFDFKALKGTAEIKEIKVFYDLNYGEGDDMDTSDIYTDDANHVLITSYDKDDQMDGKRVRLRDATFPKLELKDTYYQKYNNFTYIVIRVKDEKNNSKSARVKINIIPHLFDLTDADYDYRHQSLLANVQRLDMTDKKQFYI